MRIKPRFIPAPYMLIINRIGLLRAVFSAFFNFIAKASNALIILYSAIFIRFNIAVCAIALFFLPEGIISFYKRVSEVPNVLNRPADSVINIPVLGFMRISGFFAKLKCL
jgi:hypothetical protein